MPGAHVTRVGFPGTIDEFEAQLDERGRTDIENLLTKAENLWSTPSWAQVNDVVFFQMTLSGARKWRQMHRLLFETRHDFFPEDPDAFLPDWFVRLRAAYLGSNREVEDVIGRSINELAGCVFAFGRIAERSESALVKPSGHFRQARFAAINQITPIKEPVRVVKPAQLSGYSEFTGPGPLAHRSFRSEDAFRKLVQAIADHQPTPKYLDVSRFAERRNVTRENWMDIATQPDAAYPTEAHLRASFSDHLLREMSTRSRLSSEVSVSKDGEETGVVDNVIWLGQTALPVEIKLNALTADHLADQLARYAGPAALKQQSRTIARTDHDVVLLVDNEGLYLTRRGEFFDSSLKSPLLHRTDINTDSLDAVRGKLERMLEQH